MPLSRTRNCCNGVSYGERKLCSIQLWFGECVNGFLQNLALYVAQCHKAIGDRDWHNRTQLSVNCKYLRGVSDTALR